MLKKPSLRSLNFPKILAALSLIFLASCAGKPDQPTEIRIVDLNGNPKPVRRMVPEGNAQILASQNENFALANPEPAANPPVLQNYQKPGPTFGSDLSAPATVANVAENKPTENKPTENKPFETTVSYDMSNAQTSETNPAISNSQPPQTTNSNKRFKLAVATVKTGNTKITSHQSNSGKSGIFIQIGSFSSPENANKALEQSKQIAAGIIEEADLGGKKNYRVFLGPSSSLKKANIILKKAKKSGHKDAFIVK